MLEEHADRDEILGAARKARNVLRNGIVQRDLAGVVENHQRGRRADDFREGRKIVDRMFGADGRAGSGPTQRSESLFQDRGPSTSNDDGRTGIPTGGDPALDDMIDFGEAFAGHAHGFGGLQWKTTAIGNEQERDRRDQQRLH